MKLLATLQRLTRRLNRSSGQASWAIASQLATSGANFLLVLYLVRAAKVEQFGRYSLYYLIALNLSAVLQSLVAMPAVSIGALEKAEDRVCTIGRATSFYLLYAFGIIIAVVAADVGLGFWLTLDISLTLAGGMFAAIALAEYLRRLLFLIERGGLALAFDALRYGLTFLACGYCAAILDGPPRAETFVVALLSAQVVAILVVLAIPSVIHAVRPRWFNMQPLHRRIWRSGGWLGGTSILQFCNEHLFVVVGFAFVGPQTIGIVRASQTLVGLVNPMLYALENFVPLQLGQRIVNQGSASAIAYYFRQALIIGMMFAIILLGIAIFAQPLLSLMLGDDPQDFVWLLQAFCLVELLLVIRVLLAFPFRSVEKTRPIFSAIFLAACFSCAAALPLIYQLGVNGLVLGIAGSQLVAGLALATIVVRERHRLFSLDMRAPRS